MSIGVDIKTTNMDSNYAILSSRMDRSPSEKFSEWLVEQLREHKLSMTALALRAGVSKQVISKYINQPPEKPDMNVLKGIAHGFGIPQEEVFRAAGVLAPVPEKDEAIDELEHLAAQMSGDDLQDLIEYARLRLRRSEDKQEGKKSSRTSSPARSR